MVYGRDLETCAMGGPRQHSVSRLGIVCDGVAVYGDVFELVGVYLCLWTKTKKFIERTSQRG